MLDLTQKNPKQLNEHDARLRAWEVEIEAKAQAAQDYVDTTEVLDGRPRHKRKLLTSGNQPK